MLGIGDGLVGVNEYVAINLEMKGCSRKRGRDVSDCSFLEMALAIHLSWLSFL